MPSPDQLLAVLWRRRASFGLTFVLMMVGVALATLLLPKVYSTSSYLWVSATRQPGSDYEAVQTNQVLIKTFAELMQTKGVGDAVARALPYPLSPSAVRRSVSVSPVSQSQLIKIRAESPSPARARILADTYAALVVDRTRAIDPDGASSRQILLAERAPPAGSPIRPQPKLYLLVGSVLALLCAAVVAAFRERFDQRLDIDTSTTEILGLPLIARVPFRSRQPLHELLAMNTEDGAANDFTEAFRTLVANLTFVHPAERLRSIAVVSATEAEGKSICCMGLAWAVAERDQRVLLVDGDLRRPALAARLQLPDPYRPPGLSNLLVPSAALALNEVAVETARGFHLIPSGPPPPNPAALLAQGIQDVDLRAKTLSDLVVYDTPPVSIGSDASLVAAVADATVLVIDFRKARRAAVVQAVDQLRRARANVVGVVVNRVPPSSHSYRYYGPRADAERAAEAAGGAPAEKDLSDSAARSAVRPQA